MKEKEYVVNVDNEGKIQFHDKLHNLVFIQDESSHKICNGNRFSSYFYESKYVLTGCLNLLAAK